VPVPGIVFDKFDAMKSLGVSGAMLNWIPGGFPSLMLLAAGRAASASGTKRKFLEELAIAYWPMDCVDRVVRAWTCFETGFQEYPFTNRFFYYGPIMRAPAYPLRLARNPNHASPLNWGINRHRTPQPFEEDVQRWLGPFSEREITDQLSCMIRHWDEGLACLDSAAKTHPTVEARRQLAVASAAGGHFRGAKNVIEFLSHRDRLKVAPTDRRAAIIGRMKEIVVEQITLAGEFKEFIQIEPAIGYQSEILDYSYDVPLLDEAIVINRRTLETLDGPADAMFDALNTTLPVIPTDRSIPNLDVHGD
jgi:hypothetical protein